MHALLNKNNMNSYMGILQETFLLFCLLLPAGFGFFAIMLALSFSSHETIKTNPILIIALTTNRVGRILSAISIFKIQNAVLVGIIQSLGLLCLLIGNLLDEIPIFFIIAAFFLGISLTAGNVFFRTLLTSGISCINNTTYSVLFYVFWGIGIVFCGLTWNSYFRNHSICAMLVISLMGCFILHHMLYKAELNISNPKIIKVWAKAKCFLEIFSLSVPALIVACIAILFNAALVPVLTKNFGFSGAEIGLAAGFIVIGNILALLINFPRKIADTCALSSFCLSVVGNIFLVICLFLLRDSKIVAFWIIIAIGLFSSLSLKFQMDFVCVNADKKLHCLIHALSEILSVICGIGFVFVNKFGLSLSIQFVSIALFLFVWWSLVKNKYGEWKTV